MSLVLFRLGSRCKRQIEVARIKWLFILAQGRIIRRRGHGEAGRQPRVQQPGALQLLKARQVAERLQAELGEERVRGAESARPARRLAPAPRLAPTGLQEHV